MPIRPDYLDSQSLAWTVTFKFKCSESVGPSFVFVSSQLIKYGPAAIRVQ